MKNLVDITGHRFGRWTVVSLSHKVKTKVKTSYFWNVICECGTTRVLSRSKLGSGQSLSCGCSRVESIERIRDEKVYHYKNGAKSRCLAFELPNEEVYLLFSQNCFYCGTEPSNVRRRKKGGSEFRYNGIDRVDNAKGYTSGNVVSCCKSCNIAKHAMPAQDFISLCKRVAERHSA
jgi:hypothetical protein